MGSDLCGAAGAQGVAAVSFQAVPQTPQAPPAPATPFTRWTPVLVALVGLVAASSLGPLPPDQAYRAFSAAEHLSLGEGLPAGAPLLWSAALGGLLQAGGDPLSAAVACGLFALAALPIVIGRLARAGARAQGELPAWSPLVALALLLGDADLALVAVEGLATLPAAALLAWGVSSLLSARWRQAGAGAHLWAGLILGLAAALDLVAAIGVLALLLLIAGAALRPRRGPARLGPLLMTALVALPPAFLAPRPAGAGDGAWGLSWMGGHVLSHPALWLLVALRPVAGPPTRRSWALSTMAAAMILLPSIFLPSDALQARQLALVSPLLCVLAAESAAGLVARWGGLRVGATGLLLLAFGLSRGTLATLDRAGLRAAEGEQARRVGRALANQLPRQTLLALHPAGAIPYYARLSAIDLRGDVPLQAARPDVVLPGEGLLALTPQTPPMPPPLFTADLADYRVVVLPLDEEWLHLWVRKGFLEERFPGMGPPG